MEAILAALEEFWATILDKLPADVSGFEIAPILQAIKDFVGKILDSEGVLGELNKLV
ncbi:MAG: hypothetical protein LBT21_00290 [Oscillospiraceae bacterium]|jgi:hypothetical protein|nr:hypothetical protein [Oscillospiraceae bacterium]